MFKFIEDFAKNKFTVFYWYILKFLEEDIFIKKEYFYKSKFQNNGIYLDNYLIHLDNYLIHDILGIKTNYELIDFLKVG